MTSASHLALKTLTVSLNASVLEQRVPHQVKTKTNNRKIRCVYFGMKEGHDSNQL
jgi:hypothetical protein